MPKPETVTMMTNVLLGGTIACHRTSASIPKVPSAVGRGQGMHRVLVDPLVLPLAPVPAPQLPLQLLALFITRKRTGLRHNPRTKPTIGRSNITGTSGHVALDLREMPSGHVLTSTNVRETTLADLIKGVLMEMVLIDVTKCWYVQLDLSLITMQRSA